MICCEKYCESSTSQKKKKIHKQIHNIFHNSQVGKLTTIKLLPQQWTCVKSCQFFFFFFFFVSIDFLKRIILPSSC